MIVRVATEEDIPALIDIARVFCEESKWGWTFDSFNAANSFFTAIRHNDMIVFGVFDDDKIVGFTLASIECDFTVETIGDIVEFFIHPTARGTKAGRSLLVKVCEWFDQKKCKSVFVKSTGNVDRQDIVFQNLFKKFGFKVFSNVLVR